MPTYAAFYQTPSPHGPLLLRPLGGVSCGLGSSGKNRIGPRRAQTQNFWVHFRPWTEAHLLTVILEIMKKRFRKKFGVIGAMASKR